MPRVKITRVPPNKKSSHSETEEDAHTEYLADLFIRLLPPAFSLRLLPISLSLPFSSTPIFFTPVVLLLVFPHTPPHSLSLSLTLSLFLYAFTYVFSITSSCPSSPPLTHSFRSPTLLFILLRNFTSDNRLFFSISMVLTGTSFLHLHV
jgi:hypothetical protein